MHALIARRFTTRVLATGGVGFDLLPEPPMPSRSQRPASG
jgi:hypothetical protein